MKGYQQRPNQQPNQGLVQRIELQLAMKICENGQIDPAAHPQWLGNSRRAGALFSLKREGSESQFSTNFFTYL